MPIICPRCGKDDVIQKVSAVVTGGQSSGTFFGPTVGVANVGGKVGLAGGYTALEGGNVTEIARLLAAPVKPEAPPESLFPVILIGLGAIFGFFPAVLFIAGATQDPTVGIIAVIFLCGGIPLWAHARKKRLYATRQTPLWSKAMRIWDGLYYCWRDDLVFSSDGKIQLPPDKVQDYCNE